MEWVLWLIAVVVALSVGSFINVVVYRLPAQIINPEHSISVWRPRSHCVACKQVLGWRDILPVVSWLLLRGRCRFCQCAISARYPGVEIASALFCLTMIVLLPVDRPLAATLMLFWLLLTLSLIDIDHLLLPDVITQPLLWLGLLLKAVEWIPGSLSDGVFGAILGYGALWCMATTYQWIKGIPALGMGDTKLVAALGAWLGWTLIPLMLLLACSGAILAIFIGKMCVHRDLHQPLAFGPWIALAAISLFINTII